MSTDEIISRTRLLENDIKVVRVIVVLFLIKAHRGFCTNLALLQIMKSETSRISHEQQAMKEKIKVKTHPQNT